MLTGTARFTAVTIHAGALVTALLALSGAAILRPGPAAGTSQDDQFLALLDQEGIPALEGVPSLVDTAHKVCRAIDAGYSAGDVINAMVEFAYSQDPAERQYAPGRLARTEARFITAAVKAYCPYDQGKIASIAANPAAGWTMSARPGSAHDAVSSRGVELESRIAAVPAGEITQPDPPEIPAPPPVAHLQTPRPIAAPPRPQQAPRPQQPAPRPQQVAPPPQQPPPPPPQPAPPPPPPPPAAPPMSPGFVRLAP